jgi:hypothetical protein
MSASRVSPVLSATAALSQRWTKGVGPAGAGVRGGGALMAQGGEHIHTVGR